MKGDFFFLQKRNENGEIKREKKKDDRRGEEQKRKLLQLSPMEEWESFGGQMRWKLGTLGGELEKEFERTS